MILRTLREIRLVMQLLPAGEHPRWWRAFFLAAPEALRNRSLGPVDQKLGTSFSIRRGEERLKFAGCDFGVVREIFGQRCYGQPEDFRDARVVLDLGANCGVFTLFALVHAPHARVYSVEAQPEMARALAANLEANGHRSRVVIENALVGGISNPWSEDLVRRHPGVGRWELEHTIPDGVEIDFMKCDVEGAEFPLFEYMPPWIRRVRRFALEYHGPWEKGAELAARLRDAGFCVSQRSHRNLGYLAGRRIDD